MSNPVTSAIVSRLRATHAAMNKQAAEDTGGVSDPNDRGNTSVPKDEKADNALAALPQNSSGAPAARNDAGNTSATHAGLNCPVPATGDQNAKDDAATSPTTDLGKIANNLRNLMADFNGKPQSAPAKQAGNTQAQGWDPSTLTKLANSLGVDEQTISTMTPESFADFTRTKLANTMSLILEAEGGADAVAEILEKKAGQDEARAVIQQAINSHAMFSKEASYEQHQAALYMQELDQAQQALAEQFNYLTAGATQHDVIKMAHYEAAIDQAAEKFNEQGLQAFLIGMKRAAADVEGIEQGMDPSALEQGQMPPDEEGQEQPSEDGSDLEAALTQALHEGKITPEMAAQIIQELQGAEGGEGDEGSPEAAAEDDIKTACAGLGLQW